MSEKSWRLQVELPEIRSATVSNLRCVHVASLFACCLLDVCIVDVFMSCRQTPVLVQRFSFHAKHESLCQCTFHVA